MSQNVIKEDVIDHTPVVDSVSDPSGSIVSSVRHVDAENVSEDGDGNVVFNINVNPFRTVPDGSVFRKDSSVAGDESVLPPSDPCSNSAFEAAITHLTSKQFASDDVLQSVDIVEIPLADAMLRSSATNTSECRLSVVDSEPVCLSNGSQNQLEQETSPAEVEEVGPTGSDTPEMSQTDPEMSQTEAQEESISPNSATTPQPVVPTTLLLPTAVSDIPILSPDSVLQMSQNSSNVASSTSQNVPNVPMETGCQTSLPQALHYQHVLTQMSQHVPTGKGRSFALSSLEGRQLLERGAVVVSSKVISTSSSFVNVSSQNTSNAMYVGGNRELVRAMSPRGCDVVPLHQVASMATGQESHRLSAPTQITSSISEISRMSQASHHPISRNPDSWISPVAEPATGFYQHLGLKVQENMTYSSPPSFQAPPRQQNGRYSVESSPQKIDDQIFKAQPVSELAKHTPVKHPQNPQNTQQTNVVKHTSAHQIYQPTHAPLNVESVPNERYARSPTSNHVVDSVERTPRIINSELSTSPLVRGRPTVAPHRLATTTRQIGGVGSDQSTNFQPPPRPKSPTKAVPGDYFSSDRFLGFQLELVSEVDESDAVDAESGLVHRPQNQEAEELKQAVPEKKKVMVVRPISPLRTASPIVVKTVDMTSTATAISQSANGTGQKTTVTTVAVNAPSNGPSSGGETMRRNPLAPQTTVSHIAGPQTTTTSESVKEAKSINANNAADPTDSNTHTNVITEVVQRRVASSVPRARSPIVYTDVSRLPVGVNNMPSSNVIRVASNPRVRMEGRNSNNSMSLVHSAVSAPVPVTASNRANSPNAHVFVQKSNVRPSTVMTSHRNVHQQLAQSQTVRESGKRYSSHIGNEVLGYIGTLNVSTPAHLPQTESNGYTSSAGPSTPFVKGGSVAMSTPYKSAQSQLRSELRSAVMSPAKATRDYGVVTESYEVMDQTRDRHYTEAKKSPVMEKEERPVVYEQVPDFLIPSDDEVVDSVVLEECTPASATSRHTPVTHLISKSTRVSVVDKTSPTAEEAKEGHDVKETTEVSNPDSMVDMNRRVSTSGDVMPAVDENDEIWTEEASTNRRRPLTMMQRLTRFVRDRCCADVNDLQARQLHRAQSAPLDQPIDERPRTKRVIDSGSVRHSIQYTEGTQFDSGFGRLSEVYPLNITGQLKESQLPMYSQYPPQMIQYDDLSEMDHYHCATENPSGAETTPYRDVRSSSLLNEAAVRMALEAFENQKRGF